jgi:hypothetical protein
MKYVDSADGTRIAYERGGEEAALLATNIGKVILAEPPMYTRTADPLPTHALAEIRAALEAGERERALLSIHEAGGMTPAELNLLRSVPS